MLKSWPYRLLALAAASVAAALVLATEIVAIYIIGDLVSPDYTNPMVMVFAGLAAAIFAAPAFLLGLIFVGGPCWWTLHQFNWTSLIAAMTAGAVGSVTVGAITLWVFGLPWESIATAALLALPGGIAGWVVRAVAYDRAKPPQPPPAPPS